MAAMVMTPPLLNPAKSSLGVAIPSRPAITNAQASASTAGTRPVVITTRVAITSTAATAAIARNLVDSGAAAEADLQHAAGDDARIRHQIKEAAADVFGLKPRLGYRISPHH